MLFSFGQYLNFGVKERAEWVEFPCSSLMSESGPQSPQLDTGAECPSVILVLLLEMVAETGDGPCQACRSGHLDMYHSGRNTVEGEVTPSCPVFLHL